MLIPYVGTSGKFRFLSPVKDKLDEDKEYRVIAIKSLESLADANIDAVKLIYEAMGLTKEDYLEDYKNHIPVVDFRDDANNFYAVPGKYIESIPDITGRDYRQKIVSIDFGYLPDDTEFTTVVEYMKQISQQLIGVEPEIKLINASPVTIIPFEEDRIKTAERNTVIQGSESIFYLYKKCTKSFEELKNNYNILLDIVTKD